MSSPRRSGLNLPQLASRWGLLILLVLLIAIFSALKPDTFPTYFNLRSIVTNKSVQALLALAVFLPMTANHFDLSAGFLLGIAQVLVIGFQAQGLGWPEAAALVLLLGLLVGLFNGLLVTVVGIDSFIATLGTGTLLYGINEWYTGGQQVIASLPDSFINLSGVVGGVPLPALYVLGLALVLWVAFEYLPLGRHLYVLGASPKAAELNGHLGAALRHRSPDGGRARLRLRGHRAPVAAAGRPILGRPGIPAAGLHGGAARRDLDPPRSRQCLGTILAVALLAVTVAGLNQLGAPFFVEPIFNGATLIVAVGLAVTAARRRTRMGSAGHEAPAAAAAAD